MRVLVALSVPVAWRAGLWGVQVPCAWPLSGWLWVQEVELVRLRADPVDLEVDLSRVVTLDWVLLAHGEQLQLFVMANNWNYSPYHKIEENVLM